MNAEAKHTPGPWQQRGKFIYATGGVDTFSGPVIGVIASCEETEQTDGEGRVWSVAGDALANARLISAAPEMLEALKGIADFAKGMASDIAADIQEGGEWTDAVREQARKWDAVLAALSKAEGRS